MYSIFSRDIKLCTASMFNGKPILHDFHIHLFSYDSPLKYLDDITNEMLNTNQNTFSFCFVPFSLPIYECEFGWVQD